MTTCQYGIARQRPELTTIITPSIAPETSDVHRNYMSGTIIIVGGGVGGLALAHGLKKNGIPFHIYERDNGRDFRAQGYRIRVARDAVAGLEYLFDHDTWHNFELTCGETRLGPIVEVDTETGRVDLPNVDDPGPPPGTAKPYTVDRTMFRNVMLRDMDRHISYGKAFERFEETQDGGVTAFFADGGIVHGALLVGADGAHSNVRRQCLPSLPIVPTGGVCVYGKTMLTQELLKTLEPAVLRGMNVLKDRSHAKYSVTVLEPVVFARRAEMEVEGFACPPDYLYWVLSAQPDALGLTEGVAVTRDEAAAMVEQISEAWHPSVRGIFKEQLPGSTAVLPINSVPADFAHLTWEPQSRATMIGDAIHVMGPTSGSGAIVALRDASTLCRLLTEGGREDLGATIRKYEAEMRIYAGEVVAASWKNGQLIFRQARGNDRHIGEVMIANRNRKQ